jgi:hypothetical protein
MPTNRVAQSNGLGRRRYRQKLFLPFTPNGAETERRAIEVKEALGLCAEDAIDPFHVLPLIPARLLCPQETAGLFAPEVYRALFQTGVAEWSAVGWGRSPATDEELISLNPRHHPHRQRASLMEEVVHILLDHPKVAIQIGDAGRASVRSFDKAIEDEAYCVGAACILPYPALFNAVHRAGDSAASIAARLSVSRDYVEYRIKRSGLAGVYYKRQRGE